MQPPGTSMAPTIMLSICIAATLLNAFRWLFSPLKLMAATGLKGYVLPSIVMVLPILASVTNSLAMVRIVSTGTELNLEAYSGVYVLTCSRSNWNAGVPFTPLTS